MTAIDQLVDNASNWSVDEALAAPPSLGVVIVTCMDARIDVYRLFGLELGQAHVLRNGGGAVTDDVIRSLSISQRELGTTEVLVMHHTPCGLQGLSSDKFLSELERDTGVRPSWAVEGFADAEADVRQSIERIRRSPFIPHKDGVRGFVYDVETGALKEIDA